jgi:hypothetical protein
MPLAPSPAQQAASRANGARSRGPATDAGKARAALNGTRHGLRGGRFALLPGEDADELAALERAAAADWRPRDAHERHWTGELVAAMWRQRRLRGLELAALAAAEAESPPSEASLKRLLTFARYGARLDGDIGRALRALRSLKGRPDGDLAEAPARTPEPEPHPAIAAPAPARTSGPEPAAPDHRAQVPVRTTEPEALPPPAPSGPRPLNRRERRRAALARKAGLRAA